MYLVVFIRYLIIANNIYIYNNTKKKFIYKQKTIKNRSMPRQQSTFTFLCVYYFSINISNNYYNGYNRNNNNNDIFYENIIYAK